MKNAMRTAFCYGIRVEKSSIPKPQKYLEKNTCLISNEMSTDVTTTIELLASNTLSIRDYSQ